MLKVLKSGFYTSVQDLGRFHYRNKGVPVSGIMDQMSVFKANSLLENDDVDFYYEENNPSNQNQYRYKNEWVSYETISKTIKVKDSSDISFSFKKSVHGPILNGIADQVAGERPVAMSWIYTQMENKVIDAVYEMSHADNLDQFKAALPAIHAPGLNIMYGDADGNVAWFASAQLYEIPDSVNTKMIYEVGDGLKETKNFLDFSKNPQAINPPWRYVYSANNQPDSIAGMLYPGYYLPENRAKRIVELLEPKNDWDMTSTSEMIVDVKSSVNPDIVKNLLKLVDISSLSDKQLKILDLLNTWEGDYLLESVAATVYTRLEYYFLENTFKDELGEEWFNQLLSTHFSKRIVAPMAEKNKSVWWDNVGTSDTVEDKNMIVQKSYLDAIASLEQQFGSNLSAWTWDKVHTLEHPHPIGQVKALRSFFNVGPFPVHGTREVINNMYFPYDSTGLYKTSTGPSTRRIIDFSDIENSISILPTGQSGNPFSSHYKDQAEMYVKGEFRKMMMNEEEIKMGKEILTFSPKD